MIRHTVKGMDHHFQFLAFVPDIGTKGVFYFRKDQRQTVLRRPDEMVIQLGIGIRHGWG
jgi:hypothetical protein